MRIRNYAMAMLICGTALTAGCPLSSDFVPGSNDDVIADGTYKGNVSAIVEFWQEGQLVGQDGGGVEDTARFIDGAALTDSGKVLQIGDWEDLEMDALLMSREVYDIEIGEWAYQVSYNVTAEWDSVPMEGREFITFSGNADGSLAMFDTIELTSLDEYDGGAWTFHVNASGTFSPGREPQVPSGDILYQRSGKTRR